MDDDRASLILDDVRHGAPPGHTSSRLRALGQTSREKEHCVALFGRTETTSPTSTLIIVACRQRHPASAPIAQARPEHFRGASARWSVRGRKAPAIWSLLLGSGHVIGTVVGMSGHRWPRVLSAPGCRMGELDSNCRVVCRWTRRVRIARY
jgi:hypothetical protein